MAAGNYWMALMNLYISPGQVIWPRVVMIVGLSMIFAPINVAAFKYIPPHLRGAAVGLFALLRNEGGSVGTSMAQAIEWRREQFPHGARGRVSRPLQPGGELVPSSRAEPSSSSRRATRPRRSRWPCRRLTNLRQQQASSLAYFDDFWLFAVLGAGARVSLVLLMKRSVAEKGAHIGAE